MADGDYRNGDYRMGYLDGRLAECQFILSNWMHVKGSIGRFLSRRIYDMRYGLNLDADNDDKRTL